MYSCHLFLISSTSVRSIPFLSIIVPIFAWYAPLVSNSLEEISSLSHSIVFFYFLHYSFKKTFLSLFAILWNSVFSWVYLFLTCLFLPSLLSSAICKASSDNHFGFLYFFFLGMILVTANGMDLTEAEDTKKRWQEYTEELYRKDRHDQDNHNGVITHLEPSWIVKSNGP